MHRLFNYHARVYDPRKDQTVDYHFRAMTDEQARQQARDGYTGLLGDYPQDHLVVTLISKELKGDRPGDF